MDDNIYFIERLTVPVTGDFQAAVRAAAERSGLTISDYTRLALGARMARDGVRFRPLPVLHRPATRKRVG
jgi:hypothetical protein